MTETTTTDDSGNWRSRKARLAIVSLVAPWVTATVAWLILGKMEASEWVSLCQWLIPLVLAVYSSANVFEKRGAR